MDTETFLVTRDRLVLDLQSLREETLDAIQAKRHVNGNGGGFAVPFWLRMALIVVLPKALQGFWPKTLIAAAPVVYGLVKNVMDVRKTPSVLGGILGFFPIVKSFLKRYN